MKFIFFLAFSLLVAACLTNDASPSAMQTTADAPRITGCKFGKADFNPLRNNNEDYIFEATYEGLNAKIELNFCRQTVGDCLGEHGLMIVRIGPACASLPFTWENFPMIEMEYKGRTWFLFL